MRRIKRAGQRKRNGKVFNRLLKKSAFAQSTENWIIDNKGLMKFPNPSKTLF
jgi:hypothetical protein